MQLYLTRLLFLFELLFFLIRDGVQIQKPSVTIVGFLTETRISDVIVQPEVRIVARETRQKESWAQKVYSTSVCCEAH